MGHPVSKFEASCNCQYCWIQLLNFYLSLFEDYIYFLQLSRFFDFSNVFKFSNVYKVMFIISNSAEKVIIVEVVKNVLR